MLAGCGSIGEPLYPALKIPQRVTDLAVAERGPNLDFDFTIDPRSTEGVPLQEFGGVELRAGPSPANGFNEEEWLKSSTRVDVPTPDKPGPVHAELPAASFVGHEIVVAVRVTNPKGRDAGWSAFKTVQVEPPLATPADFHVAASAKGVHLTWRAAGISEFRVYRKSEQQQRPIAARHRHRAELRRHQRGVRQDVSIFGARCSRELWRATLLGPETITPVDTFPPAVPSGLTASVGLGAIELAWNRNTESDFKEYRVFRSEEGGPFVEIARGLDAPTYSDHGIQSGKRYRYQVSAVDQLSNVSAPSAPVEITTQ